MTEVASPEHRADRHVKDLELKWHNSEIDRCSRDPKLPTCIRKKISSKSFMLTSTEVHGEHGQADWHARGWETCLTVEVLKGRRCLRLLVKLRQWRSWRGKIFGKLTINHGRTKILGNFPLDLSGLASEGQIPGEDNRKHHWGQRDLIKCHLRMEIWFERASFERVSIIKAIEASRFPQLVD